MVNGLLSNSSSNFVSQHPDTSFSHIPPKSPHIITKSSLVISFCSGNMSISNFSKSPWQSPVIYIIGPSPFLCFFSLGVALLRIFKLNSLYLRFCSSSAPSNSRSFSIPSECNTAAYAPIETVDTPFSIDESVSTLIPARSATSSAHRFLRSLALFIFAPAFCNARSVSGKSITVFLAIFILFSNFFL